MDILANNAWFTSQFTKEADSGFDYVSRDGKIGLQLKLTSHGVRDLHAGLLGLALLVPERKNLELACLIVGQQRIASERVKEEWNRVRKIMKPGVASHMGIISLVEDTLTIEPADPRLIRIGEIFKGELDANSKEGPSLQLQAPRKTSKFDELTKVLLVRWLKDLGPIKIGELANQVGCAMVTALFGIRLLSARGVLNRVPNRPVALAKFPTEWWSGQLASDRNSSNAWRFVDITGQPSDLEFLQKRISKLDVPGLAIGGVQAARHWCPDLDLNGLPRLDLVLHTPDGKADLNFIRRLDPALKLASSPTEPATVVVHPLQRADPLFEHVRAHGLPVADPVETARHLEELHLPSQAKQVLLRFRTELKHL